MALTAHALKAGEVKLKSVSNEEHFTVDAKTVIHPLLPSHCSGVLQISHMAIAAHVLRAVQVRLNSVSNGGHFTLEAHTAFRPYLPEHFSGVPEI
jgi:hypothetical protein